MEKLNLQKRLYKSKDAAINDHQLNYHSSGSKSGKFHKNGADANRISFIVNKVADESKVLDVGCNDGSMGFILLKEKKCTVFGIDPVKSLVLMAQSKGILAKIGNVEDLSLPDDKFDYVIAAEVLEHLYDPYEGLKEIHRVLKPNRFLIGSVPHPDGRMGKQHKTGGDYHQTIFETFELQMMLEYFFENVIIEPILYNEKFEKNDNPQWNGFICQKISLLKQ